MTDRAPPTVPRAASPRITAALLGMGVAFDLALNGQRPGLSVPILVGMAAAALAAVIRARSRRIVLAAAVVFSVFPAIRASELLASLDALAVASLLGVASALEARETLQPSFRLVVVRARRLVLSVFDGPRFLFAPFARLVRSLPARAAVPMRAVLITVPVLALFAFLLASADRVFGRLIIFRLPHVDAGPAFSHLMLTAVGTAVATALWRRATTPSAEPAPPTPARGFLSPPEWVAILSGIDALFAIFVVVQFAFLFGGRHRVMVTPGLTYAEYARSGFFQLIAVAVLAEVVTVLAWDHGRRLGRSHDRLYGLLVATMVVLCFVILASAQMRLWLYEDAFGFTTDRLLASFAIGWIGVVLAATAVMVWTGRRERLFVACATAALGALAVLNVLNPDRFIAQHNVARFRAGRTLDVAYLGERLGPDAIPTAVATLPALPPPLADELRSALCVASAELGPEPSWRSWNLGRARARSALAAAGITEVSCSFDL